MTAQKSDSRPVRGALDSALRVRYEQLCELLGALPSRAEWEVLGTVAGEWARNAASASQLETASRVHRWFRALEPLMLEIRELESWSGPPLGTAEKNSAADCLARLLLSNGMEFSDAAKSAEPARKKRSGAPVKRRFVAAQALEVKKLNPRMSWMQTAIQCCNCGESKHTERCSQVLRQEVMALERVLRKYGIHPWDKQPTNDRPKEEEVVKL